MSADRVPRFVAVWCPNWPLVAAGVPAGQPAAVLRANRVLVRNLAAGRHGVRIGDRRRAAFAACPELLIVDHDPDRDRAAFEPVIHAVIDMVPRLEVAEPGLLCFAARGPSRYFGGDVALAQRLCKVVQSSLARPSISQANASRGIQPGPADIQSDECVPPGLPHGELPVAVTVGVADGRLAAITAARLAHRGGLYREDGHEAGAGPQRWWHAVPLGGSPAFLSGLPVGWLSTLGETSADMVDLFVRLGLDTLGSLARLATSDALARFGREGAHAVQLARGVDRRLPHVTDPPEQRDYTHTFDEPVHHLDPAVFAAKQCADRMASDLAAVGQVCVEMHVAIESDHGDTSERTWYHPHGLTATAMVDRVRWQIDRWVRQHGEVTGGVALLRLAPVGLARNDGVQTGLWGGRSLADQHAARAIARLGALAGVDAVCVPTWVGGRTSGERYEWLPAALVDLDDPASRFADRDEPWPGAFPAPRPALTCGEQVDVLDADGRPIVVGGRGEISAAPVTIMRGKRAWRVANWAGPWPLDQGWWEAGRHRRMARMQVVLETGEAWLVAVEKQIWSISAQYA